MVAEVLNNSDLHFEHVQWKSELNFWKDEIKTFNHRLEELVSRWTDKEMLKQLEHFQNKFIIHRDAVDNLNHEINVHESGMATLIKNTKNAMNRENFTEHMKVREQMETQRQMYSDLKKDFFRFLSKYM